VVHVDAESMLVRQAVSGDAGAFEELVRRYQHRIVNLTRVLGGGNDAEDLAQEAFLRAYRGLGRFRGDSAFHTWLFRITVNVVRSHVKRRQRWHWPWVRSLDSDEGPPPPEAAAPAFEHDWVRRDAIDRALAAIPADLRAVVVLRDLEGLAYRDIAEVLQVPLGTVESRLHRARQTLKPLLAPLVRSVGSPD
jgi:RNA polymerase sigma-70 factor (ECF subfamily)